MNRKLRDAIETLMFVRDAGMGSTLSAETILDSVRKEAAATLILISARGYEEAAGAQRRRRAAALRKFGPYYRPVYTPETAPTSLHQLLVERVGK